MNKRPLVSVVVPIYKTPKKYLKSCIESILNQTIRQIEVILVDDGSPDNCGKICDEYAAKDKRVKAIHQTNNGVSSARNNGLQYVTGEFLTYVDSDDRLSIYAWERALKAFDDPEIDCVVFGWHDFTADGKYEHKVTDEYTKISAKEAVYKIASDNIACGGGYPWNKIWRVDAIKDKHQDIPKWSTAIYTYEDKLWILNVLKNIHAVALIPNVLYEYRYVPTSLTQSEEAWRKRQFNAYDAYDLILDTVQDYDHNAYMGAIKFYFYFCLHDLRVLYHERKKDPERYTETRQRLIRLCKRIKYGDLHKFKYILIRRYMLLTQYFKI
jgi:glycosyltransferase involved in cell wall biosynthesis